MNKPTLQPINLQKITKQNMINEKLFKSWQDFIIHFMNNEVHDSVKLWRGQGNANWHLKSSLKRNIEKKLKDKKTYYNITEKFILQANYNNLRRNRFSEYDNISNHLSLPLSNELTDSSSDYNNFYKAMKKCILKNSNEIVGFGAPIDFSSHLFMDLRHWAWGQHYGVKSPLLDWTIRPFLALYFAVSGYDESSNSIAIYSLNPRMLRKLNEQPCKMFEWFGNELKQEYIDIFISKVNTFFKNGEFPESVLRSYGKLKDTNSFVKYCEIIIDAMKLKLIIDCEEQNSRQITQNGVFSFTPNFMTIEEWCDNYLETFSESEFALVEKVLIQKYIISFSKKDKVDCLQFLDSANINAKTIYPDFQGLSDYMEELEDIQLRNF